MARRRKKKHQDDSGVEVNLTAMLDMAFQLLAFFVLTFKPPPTEGQISLRMPPPQPVVLKQSANKTAGSANKDVVTGLDTLLISAFPTKGGGLSMQVFDQPVATLPGLAEQLREKLTAANTPFEQVVIQVHSDLRYEQLMQVINVCASQKMSNGQPLTKLSFVELDPNAK